MSLLCCPLARLSHGCGLEPFWGPRYFLRHLFLESASRLSLAKHILIFKTYTQLVLNGCKLVRQEIFA